MRDVELPTSPTRERRGRRFVGLAIVALLALAIVSALLLDVRVANRVHDAGIARAVKNARIAHVTKWGGDFRFTLAVAAIAAFAIARDNASPDNALQRDIDRHNATHRALLAAAGIALAGILAGLTYTVLKWLVGRQRPFTAGETPFALHPFHGGVAGLFTANNQAFPSGHACLSFSTAGVLAILFPRGRWVFFALASIVSLERVAEAAHYCSDICAGAAAGLGCAWLAVSLVIDRAANSRERPAGSPVVSAEQAASAARMAHLEESGRLADREPS